MSPTNINVIVKINPKESNMSDLKNTPLVNNSQLTKLAKLTEEAKKKKTAYEEADKELKTYRESLPIKEGDTVIGDTKVKKTWRDGNEGFDLKKFREDFPEDGTTIQKTFRRVVEDYVGRGKGYFVYTVTKKG